MLSQVRIICISILLFFSSSALSQITPESGWWWNPDESGRGYSIEIQDGTIFLAIYTYEDEQTSGINEATWFFASGALQGDTVFEGALLAAEDGPCLLNCELKSPSLTLAHDIRIEFVSTRYADVTIDGENFEIQRFLFAPQHADRNEALMGEWNLVANTPDAAGDLAFIGDVLIFDDVYENGGAEYASGCRPASLLTGECTLDDDIALAQYVEELGEYLILYYIDAAQNETRTLWVQLRTNRFWGELDQQGASELHDEDAAVDVSATRTASKTYVQTGNGPAKPAVNFQTQVQRQREVAAQAKPSLDGQQKRVLQEQAVVRAKRELRRMDNK